MFPRLGVPVRFNGWCESGTVRESKPFNCGVVAHLVAQLRKLLTVSLRPIIGNAAPVRRTTLRWFVSCRRQNCYLTRRLILEYRRFLPIEFCLDHHVCTRRRYLAATQPGW